MRPHALRGASLNGLTRTIFTVFLYNCLLLAASIVYADEVQTTKVAEAYIELHTGPGRGYPVFHVVERGQQIRLIKKRTQWYKVESPDKKIGWVHEEEIALTLNADGSTYDAGQIAQRDFQSRQFEAGVLTGNYGGATALSLYGGWNFTENLATELALTQALGNVSDITFATVNLLHHPFPDWRYSPYFKLGTGIITTKPQATLIQAVDRTDETVHVGGGVKIYVSRQFFVRVEYNKHTILTSRNDNDEVEEWKIGISVFF